MVTTALMKAIGREPTTTLDLPARWLAMTRELHLAPTTAEQRRIRERRTDRAIDSGEELLLCEIGAVDPNLPPEFRAAVTARLHDPRLPLIEIDGATEAALYRCLSHTALSFDVPVPANNRLEPVMWRHEVAVATIAQRILDRRPRDARTRQEVATADGVKAVADDTAMAAARRAKTIMSESNDWNNVTNSPLVAAVVFESENFKMWARETIGESPQALRDSLLKLVAAERS